MGLNCDWSGTCSHWWANSSSYADASNCFGTKVTQQTFRLGTSFRKMCDLNIDLTSVKMMINRHGLVEPQFSLRGSDNTQTIEQRMRPWIQCVSPSAHPRYICMLQGLSREWDLHREMRQGSNTPTSVVHSALHSTGDWRSLSTKYQVECMGSIQLNKCMGGLGAFGSGHQPSIWQSLKLASFVPKQPMPVVGFIIRTFTLSRRSQEHILSFEQRKLISLHFSGETILWFWYPAILIRLRQLLVYARSWAQDFGETLGLLLSGAWELSPANDPVRDVSGNIFRKGKKMRKIKIGGNYLKKYMN